MGELIDKVKGKAKQAQGRATGDKAREAEGVADELKGDAKGVFEELKAGVKRTVRESNERQADSASRR